MSNRAQLCLWEEPEHMMAGPDGAPLVTLDTMLSALRSETKVEQDSKRSALNELKSARTIVGRAGAIIGL
jgi:hypothetical protein